MSCPGSLSPGQRLRVVCGVDSQALCAVSVASVVRLEQLLVYTTVRIYITTRFLPMCTVAPCLAMALYR